MRCWIVLLLIVLSFWGRREEKGLVHMLNLENRIEIENNISPFYIVVS